MTAWGASPGHVGVGVAEHEPARDDGRAQGRMVISGGEHTGDVVTHLAGLVDLPRGPDEQPAGIEGVGGQHRELTSVAGVVGPKVDEASGADLLIVAVVGL